MEIDNDSVLSDKIRHFHIEGQYLSAIPFGDGHINDSYCVTFSQNGAAQRYLVQRVNTRIFVNPQVLMQNIARVTNYIAAQLADASDKDRRVLHFIPTRRGELFHTDEAGGCWRVMRFIENTITLQSVRSPEQAFRVSAAFGSFQEQLASLPGPPLLDTIPHFHDTPKRFVEFEQALERNAAGRAHLAKDEIAFALKRRQIVGQLVDAGLPTRTIHNDSKSNNVLHDCATGDAICVVDLDTVMPGLAVYDFGDMVRSMTSPAPEDERDPSLVFMRFEIFEGLLRGFLHSTRTFLTNDEKAVLPASGRVVTFENGLRFLADYLNGDIYYKVHRPSQNLDRCRTQFRLVESIESQMPAMNQLVASML